MDPRLQAAPKQTEPGNRTVGYASHDAQQRVDRRVAEVLELFARRVPGRKRAHRLTTRRGNRHP